MKKQLSILLALAGLAYAGLAQQNNVGINTATPDPSAALHVESTDKGVLIPRLNGEQRQMINNAATGLLVFGTDTESFWFYNGTAWVDLSTQTVWEKNENDIYYSHGKVGIGVDSPQEELEIAGNVKANTFLGDGSQLTGLLPTNPQAGDIAFHDGDSWQRLPPGQSGDILSIVDGIPAWIGVETLNAGLLSVRLPDGEILYVYPSDNHVDIVWGPLGIDISTLPNITDASEAQMDFDGESNTEKIIEQLQNYNGGMYAAKFCADLVALGFDDWYLPAAGELNVIFQQLGPAGNNNFIEDRYWISTDFSENQAWLQSFITGHQYDVIKNNTNRCRCVRR